MNWFVLRANRARGEQRGPLRLRVGGEWDDAWCREASRFEVRHLLNRFFRNSREQLVLNILEDESIDAQELERLRQLIQEKGPAND